MKVLFLQPQSPVIKPKTTVGKTKTSVIDCLFPKYTTSNMRLSSFCIIFFRTYGHVSTLVTDMIYHNE